MTPEEAVVELIETGVITSLESDAGVVRTLIDACAATAKAEETRRCAARIRIWASRRTRAGPRQRSIYSELVNELLITGGLAVEEADAKIEP